MNTVEPTELWAIVELFGHARIAGRITAQNFGGAAMVRVDVPQVTCVASEYETVQGDRNLTQRRRSIPAHTRSFGGAAVYSINWVDEATATLAAQSIKHEPISSYSIREALRDMPAEQRDRLLAGPLRSSAVDLGDDGG